MCWAPSRRQYGLSLKSFNALPAVEELQYADAVDMALVLSRDTRRELYI